MNTIDLLLSHHSVRQFSGQSIAEETLQRLIAGAQAAPTSHYVQAYSIIGITDPALKQALAAISGQAHALNNARLLVFIADFNRHADLLEDKQQLGSAENLLVAAIDASLAAQNLCIAAESLGIGCCYLGSLRNQVAEIIRLLELPRFTFPLFGIALGYPAADADSEQKPRLPMAEIYHQNRYDSRERARHLADYDAQVQAYYAARARGQKNQQWTTQMRDFFSRPRRQEIADVLQSQGFWQL